MKLFRVAPVVVVGAGVLVVPAGALAEGALAEVVIAALAEVGVRSGIRAADGPAVQVHAVRPPEGQALLGDPQTTVRYVTVPRPGLLCLDVPAKLVVK